MSQSKKRPKQTEEDLEAAVADMISSPITRANLSFLGPSAPDQLKPQPDTFRPTPPDLGTRPPKDSPLPAQAKNSFEPPARPGVGPKPIADRSTPMGLALSPHRGLVQRQPLWQAEGIGTVFEQSRVRRVEKAGDALSKVEEQVYKLLWGTPSLQPESYRLIHYSLQRIAIDSDINIKTVRELIPRLMDKGFIAIEHPADVRRNIPTLYRVWSDTKVLENQQQRDRLYVARTGKGVFYVHPIAISIQTRPAGYPPRPMGAKPTGLGASGQPSTTLLLALADIVQQFLGLSVDQAPLNAMVMQCHENAQTTTGTPATDRELMYFTEVKARGIAQSANIRNHLQVLQKSVPTCFLGDSFRTFRQTAADPQFPEQPRPETEV